MKLAAQSFCAVFVLGLAAATGQAQAPPAAAHVSAASPRRVTVEDYFEIREVSQPQVSPDGQWVAYGVTTHLLKEDKSEERIWMVPTAGGEPVPLTAEGVSSSHARWSPDGRFLGFLSARGEGKKAVWLLSRQGGEAQRVTDLPQAVSDFAWAPDGKRLVLVLRDASPDELEAFKSKDAEKPKPKTQKPWVIDRLQFKMDGVGYLDRRRTHLYVYDLAAKSVVQVTSGDFDDSEPAWSPDGKWLAFSSNRSLPDPDHSYNRDIWVVAADNVDRSAVTPSIDKGAHPLQITKNPGSDRRPAWSPDGKWIAYESQREPRIFDYAIRHLAIAPATGGEDKVLTLALDRNTSEPQFSPDGKYVYFIADDDGTQNLCRVPVNGGEIMRPISGRLTVNAFHVGKSGTIAAQIATVDRPDEIFVLDGERLNRVTHTNDALMAQLKISPGEYVHFKSKDGTTVAGYLYKPVDYVPGQKYPTILRPHGGPVWAYYAEFSHLAQLYAANGYAVLFPNPRGSTGYGQKFAEAIFADWGNKDFQDDMAMVDYGVAQGIADPDKLGVGGWSYGGISTNFIITQTTRFQAAISGAGEALYITNYGHDHYQRDWEYELGLPWENRALYEKLSPFNRVTSVTTPTLFMGGDVDWNVPIINGEQFYQALKRLGRTTELVVYPGEYHEFSAPSHIKDRLERYLAWYGHYVKGDAAPARPEPAKPAN